MLVSSLLVQVVFYFLKGSPRLLATLSGLFLMRQGINHFILNLVNYFRLHSSLKNKEY